MQFELYTLLATTILLISLATIVFAFYSYILFRVREGKKLRKQASAHGTHAAPAPAAEPAVPEPAVTRTLPEPAVAATQSLAAAAAAVGPMRPVAPAAKPVAAQPPSEPEPAATGPKARTSGPRFFKPYDPTR